jgi:hypothetical protein
LSRIGLVGVAAGAAVAAAAIPVAAATSQRSVATGGVKIVRIYFDSPGSDTGSNTSLNAEWVQIKNVTKTRKTITAWTLRDASSHIYRFPATSLAAGHTLKVHTGRGANNGGNRYWNAGDYIWNNTGDTAGLRNSHGTVVDRCHYTTSSDPSTSC